MDGGIKSLKFRPGALVATSDPYYDLFDGGRIKPTELLENPEQALEVEKAVNLIKEFLKQSEEYGAIELF